MCDEQDTLNELIDYRDGELFWNKRDMRHCKSEHQMNAWNARYAGKELRYSMLNSGYRAIGVLGKRYLVHRLIYIMFNGSPGGEIDHVNRDKLDNRIENLRVATSAQNKHNSVRANKSGFKGVYFNKKDKRWRAQIGTGKSTIYLGNFLNKLDAAKAYNKAALEYHGEFAILNEV